MNSNEITALNLNGKESLWIDRGWRAADTAKDSGLSEAKLLGNPNTQQSYVDAGTDYAEVDTRNMSTFYNCRKTPDNPTPYATTMIIGGSSNDSCTKHSSSSTHEPCSSGTSSPHSDAQQAYGIQAKPCLAQPQHAYPQYPPSIYLINFFI